MRFGLCLRHGLEQRRRFEPGAMALGKRLQTVDDPAHADGIDIAKRSAGKWQKTKAEDRADITLHGVIDYLFGQAMGRLVDEQQRATLDDLGRARRPQRAIGSFFDSKDNNEGYDKNNK